MKRAFVLASSLFVAAPALAADKSPLTPGFWAFPSSKVVVGDALADSCSTGFSIYFENGASMSFLLEMSGDKPTLINDGESTCTFDAARNTSVCTHRDWWDGAWSETSSEMTFTVEADGRLRADYVGGGNSLTTYPLPCPEIGVREALRFLAPK